MTIPHLRRHLLAAAAALAAPAMATTVTVNQTLDLTLAAFAPSGFTGVQGAPAFGPPYSVALAEGDTFDFTIDFVGGQTLTLTNATYLWAFSYSGSPGSDVDGTGTLSLLDAAGNAFLTSNVKNTVEGSAHFGQQFDTSDFAGGLPGSLAFFGLRYTGVLNDYTEPGVTVRDYNIPAFYFVAEANSVGVVPEPATYALILAGLALVGRVARRRDGA